MANTLVNLARVQSTTIGAGTLTLGSAIAGFNTFAGAGLTDGQTVTYAIEDYSSDIPAAVVGREIGQGVYSAGTLTRGTVYSSTSAGAKINCSGRQHVLITAAAEDFASFATDLTAHLNDTSDAHDASAISFTPAGNVAATDVQAAIAELDSEKLSTSAAASAYQPLDADLTTLAANITAFGHSLVDDADNTAARTTLGLGTAAVQNTGTSGATIPLLNASNTFSALTQFTAATNLFNYADDGAGSGPNVVLRRTSASPAANDLVGAFSFSAQDSGGNLWTVGSINGQIFDPTDGSEDGQFYFATTQAGSLAQRFYIAAGAYLNGATGGDTGAGTLNATTLYENGTSLASKYQGLDSELTAIAGLTSAADRLPYFTGSGTAALATFTTAGRNLVDDADAAAQRITLGLALVDYQEFTSSGTWTKPTSVAPTLVYVELAGAGGGGGGGARTASGNASSGGGGGGGGAYMRGWFRASALSATETVTIGATGTGGNGAAADGNAGSNGTAGGNSTFGSRLTAYGGGFGAGGRLAGNSGGGGGAGWQGSGGDASGATAGSAGTLGGQAGGSGGSGTAGASPGVASGGAGGTDAAAGSNANLTMDGGGGGGSGGGISAAPAAFSGGNGGRTLTYNVGTVSGGSAGNPGTSPAASLTAGGAGAGAGGSNAAGVGGAGGTGARPGGGGGGGGSAVGGNGGRGGNGGSGICRVWSFA